ncbi:MAG: hypothetical protein QM582_08265 [Micropruina sp.]|uniref:hypothetical protein n=1 Tax=Micropruina sp. TaxID=2737536 RepID=UPI0039E29670
MTVPVEVSNLAVHFGRRSHKIGVVHRDLNNTAEADAEETPSRSGRRNRPFGGLVAAEAHGWLRGEDDDSDAIGLVKSHPAAIRGVELVQALRT